MKSVPQNTIPPSVEVLQQELGHRAGPPPRDVYLARLFCAMKGMLAAAGDSRSAYQIIKALDDMRVNEQLFPCDGK